MKKLLTAAAVCALALAASRSLAAKDVYKKYLDPASGPLDRAALDLLERLKESPNDAALHNDLGCVIARTGWWRDALREFDDAARLDKHDGKAPFNAGLVHASKGEWGSARGSFKKSVGPWPALFSIHRRCGE